MDKYGLSISKGNFRVECESAVNLICVFWERVEDAALYNVIIYKVMSFIPSRRAPEYYELSPYTSIIPIAKVTADRNVGYMSLPHLTGGNYIIKVIAENRAGEIIAETAGITTKVPNVIDTRVHIGGM